MGESKEVETDASSVRPEAADERGVLCNQDIGAWRKSWMRCDGGRG
jgi:hypothetical protein